jgi:hypothetical protein
LRPRWGEEAGIPGMGMSMGMGAAAEAEAEAEEGKEAEKRVGALGAVVEKGVGVGSAAARCCACCAMCAVCASRFCVCVCMCVCVCVCVISVYFICKHYTAYSIQHTA